MKSWRALIVGTGFMGRVHQEALRRLGNVETVAISGLVAGEFESLLADPAVDAVHICTPNALHFPMASAALQAGKHVLCEKPLATASAEARQLANLARQAGVRHATNYNLRFYPMVQQMRRMREDGDLGEIFVVQGTYSQDWLLYDTDWNWRVSAADGGPSRALADIGSHWCDLAEHITGQRITALCADLQTFHKTRQQPRGPVETFAGHAPSSQTPSSKTIETPVDTEDFAAIVFQMGERARGAYTASQVSAGCKNQLRIEIYGSKSSVAWNGERPDELWIGNRNAPNQILIKDPSLLKPDARGYADLPGGHSEGYDDTFKQIFRRFYASIADSSAAPDYPQFEAGHRQLQILEAELASHGTRAWVEVPQ
jgi:predicted dehydrogenase